MPHITKNENIVEGHRQDPDNPGEWQTLSPKGVWEPASDSHNLTLDSTFPSGAGEGAEGDYTFLLQSDEAIVRNAPNGDLISIRREDLDKDKIPHKVIVAAVNGVAPLIRLDGNGNLIAILDPTKFDDPKNIKVLVKASTAPTPTSGDIKKLGSVGLPSGQVVTYISVAGQIQSFVGERSGGRLSPFITGTEKFADGVNRVFLSDGSFRDVPPEQPLPTGFASVGEAEAAGEAAGITEPDVWVDTTGRFHFNIPDDPAPSGTKIVSENVVGDETVYELENGQVIRQKTPVDIEEPQEVDIGGQPFAFNPNTGGFQQVHQPDREFEPDVVVRDGRSFIQQPDGSLSPLGREEVPNLDELINQRILSGDAQGALALADFRDRPTSLEAFNAAMQFAQSPGDVAAISAISRGQSLVAPPPSGTVQRIAEPPEFLQDAYQRLINQFRGGTGSPEQFIDVLTKINKENDESKKKLAAAEKAQRQGGVTGIESLLDFERTGDPNEAARRAALSINEAFKFVADILFADFPEGQARNHQMNQLRDQMVRQQAAGGPSITEESILALLPDKPVGKPAGVLPDKPVVPPADKPVSPEQVQREITAFAAQFNFTAPDDTTTDTSVGPDQSGEEGGDFSDFTATAQTAADEIGFSGDVTSAAELDDFFSSQAGFDAFAKGGTARGSNLEIVGEKGPELVDLAPGSVVTPISKLSAAQLKALKKMGVRGMQEGGIVEPLLPFGVRRALSGGAIEPTRRRLSRAAGLSVLSAQGRQNLLPEELEVFNRLSREAGIPEGAFRQEQESAFPGANLARGRARFAPRVLR